MYLRNLIEDNNYSYKINFKIRFLRIFLFVLFVLIALLASSLTENESDSVISKDIIKSGNELDHL